MVTAKDRGARIGSIRHPVDRSVVGTNETDQVLIYFKAVAAFAS